MTIDPKSKASNRALRMLVIGTWVAFALGLVQSFPVQHSKWVLHLLNIPITLVGLAAAVFALMVHRRWRQLALVAAGLFMLLWFVSIIDSIVSFAENIELSRAIAQPFLIRWGMLVHFADGPILYFLAQLFYEVLMPLAQLAVLVGLRRSRTYRFSSDQQQVAES